MIIHWTSPDGLWGVIQAKDLPPGIARSKTRITIQDAAGAGWDPGNVAPVGPKSQGHFIKVRMSDLGSLAGTGGARPQVTLIPGNYANTGKAVKKFIPAYPHTCPTCGGKMLWLFSSHEHEGGKDCPGPPKNTLRRW